MTAEDPTEILNNANRASKELVQTKQQSSTLCSVKRSQNSSGTPAAVVKRARVSQPEVPARTSRKATQPKVGNPAHHETLVPRAPAVASPENSGGTQSAGYNPHLDDQYGVSSDYRSDKLQHRKAIIKPHSVTASSSPPQQPPKATPAPSPDRTVDSPARGRNSDNGDHCEVSVKAQEGMLPCPVPPSTPLPRNTAVPLAPKLPENALSGTECDSHLGWHASSGSDIRIISLARFDERSPSTN